MMHKDMDDFITSLVNILESEIKIDEEDTD